jgi:transposase
LWQIAVFFVYVMWRVDCSHCRRIVVEQVPWSDGKHQTTLTYRWFLAEWGRRLSWAETAAAFHTSCQTVFRLLKADNCRRIEYVVSHMRRNYLDVVQEFVPNAGHVLDRFHRGQESALTSGQIEPCGEGSSH